MCIECAGMGGARGGGRESRWDSCVGCAWWEACTVCCRVGTGLCARNIHNTPGEYVCMHGGELQLHRPCPTAATLCWATRRTVMFDGPVCHFVPRASRIELRFQPISVGRYSRDIDSTTRRSTETSLDDSDIWPDSGIYLITWRPSYVGSYLLTGYLTYGVVTLSQYVRTLSILTYINISEHGSEHVVRTAAPRTPPTQPRPRPTTHPSRANAPPRTRAPRPWPSGAAWKPEGRGWTRAASHQQLDAALPAPQALPIHRAASSSTRSGAAMKGTAWTQPGTLLDGAGLPASTSSSAASMAARSLSPAKRR